MINDNSELIAKIESKEACVCKVLSGSKAYELDFDNSDTDFIGIFAKPWKDLIDGGPDVIAINNCTYYELGKFGKMLIEGQLPAFEIIFSDYSHFKFTKGAFFDAFKVHASEFVSKAALSNWITTSTYLFGKSQRVAKLKANKPNIKDYLHFVFSNTNIQVVSTLTAVEERQTLDPSSAIKRIVNWENFAFVRINENLYHLFENYSPSVSKKTTGLFDENGDIIENGLLEDYQSVLLSYKGVVYFDREGYKKAAKLNKLVADSTISNGYSPKTMYHAFRILHLVNHLIRYQHYTVKCPKKEEMMEIRRASIPLGQIHKKYNELLAETQQAFKHYDGPDNTDPELVKRAVLACRDKLFGMKKSMATM